MAEQSIVLMIMAWPLNIGRNSEDNQNLLHKQLAVPVAVSAHLYCWAYR